MKTMIIEASNKRPASENLSSRDGHPRALSTPETEAVAAGGGVPGGVVNDRRPARTN